MRAISSVAALGLALTAIFAQAPDASRHFLAADIHPAAATANQAARGPFQSGQRYDLHNATMVDLIVKAYGVPADRVLDGPNWLEYDRFDIAALMPPKTNANGAKTMLQALLAERFGLVIHPDQRPMLAYLLTAPKGSEKLKESDGSSGAPGCGMGISNGPRTPDGPPPTPTGMYNCRNMTVAAFTEGLGSTGPMRDIFGSIPVQDKTGIEGNWDFNIRFPMAGSGSFSTDPTTFFDAADKQLGFKFERDTVTLPVMVVEKVNRPSPNEPDIAKKIPERPTEFDIATLKPFEPGAGPTFMGTRVQPGGRIEMNMPLRTMVMQAWGVQADSLIGAPKWMESDRYSVVAKMPADDAAPPAPNAAIDQDMVNAMMRTLLTERFQMKVHFEDRPATGYNLTALKQPKLKPADASSRTKWTVGAGGFLVFAGGAAPSQTYKFQNMTMAQFAERLPLVAGNYIHAPVVDATGIQGGYDFTLSFSPIAAAQLANLTARAPDAAAAGPDAASDPIGGTSIFEAVNKQLGLKLVEQKRTAKVLVIDHIEPKPADN